MDDRRTERREAAIRRRQTVRVVSIVAILAVVVALALDNRGSVRLGYVVGERDASLVVVLVVAFVLGAIAGLLARREPR